MSFLPLISLLAAAAPELIVVTASRTPTVLAEEPLSLAVIDRGALIEGLADHPAEILNTLPGLMVQAGSGQEHLTAIRSPALTGGAGAGSFLYLQDGVPLRSAGFANVNGLFDAQLPFAEQVEVVRGPGEVTYGSNAVHGVINVLSADPLADGAGNLRLGVGAFDRYRGTLSLQGREGQQGALVGLHHYRDGGYRADSGLEQTKAQLAHGWAGERLTVRTRAHVHRLDQETAGFVEGTRAYEDDDLRRSNPNPEAFRRSDQVLISSEWRWEGEGWSGAVTPYALATDMSFLMHFLPSQALEENSQQAVGVLSTIGRSLTPQTDLLFGLDAEWARGELFEFQERADIFSFTQGLHYDYEVTSETLAPFVRLRHAVTPKLSVQAGGRLTHTSYEYDNKTDSGIVGRFLRPEDRTDHFDAWTGKAAFLYQPTDLWSVFGSLSRGARPPQTTDLYRLQRNQTVGGIDPETLDMAEFGVRFGGEAATFELIGFAGRKENFLFRDADGFTVDSGKTTHEGVEASADVLLGRGWRAFAQGTWAIHEYDFDRVVGRATEIIRAGNRVDTAPEWLAHGGLAYESGMGWGGALTVSHVGEYFTDAANTNDYPGHTVLNVAGHYPLNDALTVRAAVKNLTDERYATRADFAFGDERYFPGEERHLTVEIDLGW